MKSGIDDEILEGIERYGLAPSQVIIELTESDLLESDQRFLQMWKRLKEKGVQLALDDLKRLLKFPLSDRDAAGHHKN